MPLDHSVPETYFKHFIDASKPGHVRLYSKSKKLCVPAHPDTICREFNGDSNPYFSNPRILDDILRAIEPKWNWAIGELEKGNITGDVLLVIALNIARLRSCTPTRKRLAHRMLENDLENLRSFGAERIDHTSEQHEDPEELKNLGHAFCIQNVMSSGLALTISDWFILENHTSKAFITSDNPAILIDFVPHHPTYIPLTPRHAVLIHVNPKNPYINDLSDLLERRDITADELSEKMTKFSKDRVIQNFTAREEAVEMLNCEIVKTAEDKIIANIEAEWIKEMIKEYKDWRVESLNTKVSAEAHSTIFHHAERAVPANSKIKILL